MTLTELLDHAERSFDFLRGRGFELRSRSVGTGHDFRDGWRIDCHSPLVDVHIEYLDQQFQVVFSYRGTSISYLMVDRELHAHRSGFYGDMFPPEKLAGAIERVATDVSAHYSDVLAGEPVIWAKLKRLSEAPVTKGKLP